VVGAVEAQHRVASRRCPGQPQGDHHSLGSRVGEAPLLRPPNARAESRGEIDLGRGRHAEAAAVAVSERGHIPFLVGGSGLYIDSVLFDYRFPSEADPTLRAELETLSTDDLIKRLQIVSPTALETIDKANRRRLIRAIETAGQPLSRTSGMRANTLAIGITLDKEVMQKRIKERIEKMLSQGFLDEVASLGEQYGWDCEAMSGIGYRALKEAVEGTKSIEVAAQEFARGDMRLVKKQLTWFKRNQSIHWVHDEAEAEELVQRFLTN